MHYWFNSTLLKKCHNLVPCINQGKNALQSIHIIITQQLNEKVNIAPQQTQF